MILKDIKTFEGQHCETTTAGTLLNAIGIELSESMLFGLGEGLYYGYLSFKGMDHPFIGGRIRTGYLTQNLCNNLNLELNIKETTSLKKAWRNVDEVLASGSPVGLQLDCYHLDYFSSKFHFGGHYVAMTGYDDQYAYLVDTIPQGTNSKTSLESLAAARSEKGPMTAMNLSFSIERREKQPSIQKAIIKAVKKNAEEFLNPPIKNFGYKGMVKTSEEIIKWFNRSSNRSKEFEETAMIMERGGTGGSLFRNMYRDFLDEAHMVTERKVFLEARDQYKVIAEEWKHVADLFTLAAQKDDIKHLENASVTLMKLSELERNAIQHLHDQL